MNTGSLRRALPRPFAALLACLLALGAALAPGPGPTGSAAAETATDAPRPGGTDPSAPAFWYGRAADGGPSVRLYFFWTPTCPHCREAKPFVEALPQRLPWVEVVSLVVKDHRANARFYFETAKSVGRQASSVPGLLYCRTAEIGYDTAATTGEWLVRELERCRARLLADPAALQGVTAVTGSGGAPSVGATSTPASGGPDAYVPLLGRISAERWSLPVLTVVLASVDAFNPCAFFVLLFLLSLLVHAKSRARMLLVGGTFVLISGVAYFAFMAAWLNFFLIAGELKVVTLAAGLLALTIGLINVKDYFWFRQGVSLSIPESAKPGLFKRMRGVVASGSPGPMLASTVLLAIVANSYELVCTAGFPMVYTRALTLADLEPWQYYAWLGVYNTIYVLPLLAIVIAFTRTMGARKLTENEGRKLKLVSGYMMGSFGAVLLFAPELLTNVLASIGVLAIALLLAVATAGVARLRPAH